jgi:TolA-binding protein
MVMNLIYSCSSPSIVKFQSTPSDAEVSVVDTNGSATVLGKTPLTSNESDVYKGSNRYSQIKVKKDGYVESEIVLMKSTTPSDISVNVQMKKDEMLQNAGDQTIIQEKVASSIARANGLIQAKQYAEAEMAMLNFVEQYPSVSVGHDYLGNIYYMQKKYAKALKSYNRAVSLSPQNADRKIIVERIQNIVKSQTGEAQ